LLILELQAPEETTLHPEAAIDKCGEHDEGGGGGGDDDDDDDDDSIHGRVVCVPTYCSPNALINKSNTCYMN
jgi:hypothetical protein